jgi:glycosyltransferase involved in cell wall biosynthesis
MNKDNLLLSIYLITYNRSKNLDLTLSQWVNSPFSKFSLTILDNNSNDQTYDVYLKYNTQINDLKYVKNKVNIGLGANILRAVEYSNSEYTWVICDDDIYDFRDSKDVIETIEKKEVDILILGYSEKFEWSLGERITTPEFLIKNNYPLFILSSFLPAIIFKTKDYQNYLSLCYDNVNNVLPQMIYFFRKYESNNCQIYISKNKIVYHANLGDETFNIDRLLIWWINTCRFLKNKTYREIALLSFFQNQSKIRSILFMSFYLTAKRSTLNTIFNVIYCTKFFYRILFITLIPLATVFQYIPMITYDKTRKKIFFQTIRTFLINK